jgi:ubiquitin carboxyl-terminal hydrolase 9/13
MSATRSTGNSVVNGEDHRRSITDRSPRPSMSSPAFVTADDETPPPVPPLPPIILGGVQHPLPSTQALPVNEPQEEKGKDKEKSRPGGNWFSKKRKSLKLGDKGKKETNTSTQSPSFVQPEDQEQSILWFSRSSSTTSTPAHQWFQPKHGPDIDAELRADPSRKGIPNQDHVQNGYDDSHSQPSGSSSPSLTSLLIHGQGTTGGSMMPSTSVSSNSSSPYLGFSLPQNGLVAGSSRLSVDRKKSLDMKVSSHPVSPFISSTQNGPHHHPLPSAPLTNHSRTHRSLPSNDYPSFSDVEAPISYNTSQMDADVNQASNRPLPPTRHVSRSSTLQSTHQNAPVGSNDGKGNNVSPAMSNSIRKLSFTSPILVLGKKDREKERR